jgi:hypothetical protein
VALPAAHAHAHAESGAVEAELGETVYPEAA